jgi:hypothetical protein
MAVEQLAVTGAALAAITQASVRDPVDRVAVRADDVQRFRDGYSPP